jgi:hypothetical protein
MRQIFDFILNLAKPNCRTLRLSRMLQKILPVIILLLLLLLLILRRKRRRRLFFFHCQRLMCY